MFVKYYIFYFLITLIGFHDDVCTKKIVLSNPKSSEQKVSSINDIIDFLSRKRHHALMEKPLGKKNRKDDEDDDSDDLYDIINSHSNSKPSSKPTSKPQAGIS